MIDFTNCKVIPGRAYNGANGNKIAIEFNGDAYMLKFPPSAEGKTTDLSYTNSCISEHIASSIFNMLEIKAQETMLGAYTVKGKEKLVCACKDFTVDYLINNALPLFKGTDWMSPTWCCTSVRTRRGSLPARISASTAV